MAVKASEIRLHCQGKVDPAVVTFLCALAEQHQALSQSLIAMAQMQDKMMDILVDMTQAMSGVRDDVQKNILGREKSTVEAVRRTNEPGADWQEPDTK